VNFARAGQVLKSAVQKLKQTLETETPTIAHGKLSVGEFQNLSLDLFERKLKTKPEYVSIVENNLTVVIDTTLTDALVDECILRETIRAVQVARQTLDLPISARIILSITSTDKRTQTVIDTNKDKICDETLATEFVKKLENVEKTRVEIEGKYVEIKFKMA